MKAKLLLIWRDLLPKLHGFVGSLQDGEDVLQNAFEFLWRTIPDDWTPREGQTAEAGLKKVIYAAVWYARLHEIDRLDMERSYLMREDDGPELSCKRVSDPFKEMDQIVADVEDEERRQHLLALVQIGLAHQEPRYQRVYQLIYFEGKSWKEAAKILGVPVSYIQSLLKVGRNRLRAWLCENIPGQPCSGSKSAARC